MLKFNKGFPTNLKWHNLSIFFKCEVIFPGITDVGAGFEFIYLFIFNFHKKQNKLVFILRYQALLFYWIQIIHKMFFDVSVLTGLF